MGEQPVDLAEAEVIARGVASLNPWVVTLVAEYDRRGEALAVLRELVERTELTGHFDNAAEGDIWLRARAVLAAAGSSSPAPADLLRRAAAGRREYAGNAPDKTRDVLLTEASTFEQAARIVEGDRHALRGALPSWRWDEPTSPALAGDPAKAAPNPDLASVARDAYYRAGGSEEPCRDDTTPAAVWAAVVDAVRAADKQLGCPVEQGEGPEEVWLPPPDDCMDHAHDPCPHCRLRIFHHRTGRCGSCGRRPATALEHR